MAQSLLSTADGLESQVIQCQNACRSVVNYESANCKLKPACMAVGEKGLYAWTPMQRAGVLYVSWGSSLDVASEMCLWTVAASQRVAASHVHCMGGADHAFCCPHHHQHLSVCKGDKLQYVTSLCVIY